MKTLTEIKQEVFNFYEEQTKLNDSYVAQQIFDKKLFNSKEDFDNENFKMINYLTINNEAKVKIRSKLLKDNKKFALYFINAFLSSQSMKSKEIAESILNEIINELAKKVFFDIEEMLNRIYKSYIYNKKRVEENFEDDIPF
tara:strand:+ start:273 stop:698 length:426 start_codon:yes stop_codon:yes gene_type:complete